jgi:hypothetical protein
MGYLLNGTFVEACDCRLMCPCWTDDEPDGGHCTGLFAWTLNPGSTIDELKVAGAQVACVTTHLGRRRGDGVRGRTLSVLFVDTSALPEADCDAAFNGLGKAFSGTAPGPLKDLAAVNGTVILVEHARIMVTEFGDTCTVRVTDVDGEQAVEAVLNPARFDGREALTLRRTALSKELGIRDEETVTAHHSHSLSIRAAALPGGYVEVTGRSGMRGPFHYVHRTRGTRRTAAARRVHPTSDYGYTSEIR